MKCDKSDVFNIGSGKLTSVQSITQKIFSFFGTKLSYRLAKQEQMDSLSAFYADISKIKRQIGWVPKVDIDKGIKKTIEQFSSL